MSKDLRGAATGAEHRRDDAASAPGAQWPADPACVLASLGFLVYSWDVRSGALSLMGDLEKVLPGDWGHQFESVSRLEESQLAINPGARHFALFGGERLDDGSGVPYALTYRLRSRDGRSYLVEEKGRWFAGLPGRAISARGLLHVRPLPSEPGEARPRRPERSDGIVGEGALHEAIDRAIKQAQRTRRSFALIAVASASRSRSSGPEAERNFEALNGRLRRVMRRGDTLLHIDAATSLAVLNACDEGQMATAVKRLEAAFEFPEDAQDDLAPARSVAGVVWRGPHADAHALAARVIDDAKARTVADRRVSAVAARQLSALSDDEWRKAILDALNERRLALACQPLVAAGSRKIAFREGLMRVRGPAGRLIPASVFVPPSERMGLVSLIDQRAIELAFEALARHPRLKLAVNASAMSLVDPQWLAALRGYASLNPELAGRLIVEITESMVLPDLRVCAERLAAIKALGVEIALDDFGSGHTSFRSLRSLPIDIVKIDGAFVQDVDRSSDGRFFVRTLVELARHIGCKIVAEWVENEDAARIVEELGVDYLQGHHFGGAKLLAEPASSRREHAVKPAPHGRRLSA